MKNLSFVLIIIAAIAIISCKKTTDPVPQTITKTVTNTIHDTVTKTVTNNVIEHDTAYCISKADIVSTWYCYKYANNINTPAWKVTFSADSAYWQSNPAYHVTYASDFSKVYLGGSSTNYYNVIVNNCNELLLIHSSGTSYYFRRLP